MDKAKYTLLQRPTVSNWPTVPRQLKLALAFTVFLVVVGILIYRTPRSVRLGKIIYVQEALVEILNLEIEFINKKSASVNDEWLPLADFDGHVYSAYFDPRPEVIDQYTHSHASDEITWGMIRIIAILPMNIDENQVDCIYKYAGANNTHILKRIQATAVKAMDDNWGLKYSAFFVLCDLVVSESLYNDVVYPESQLPSFVTIASYERDTENFNDTMQFVNVRYPNWRMNRLYEMQERFLAVCAPVFHHNFNRPLDLVEYVEYHLLLGASHFTFYNASVSPEVNRVLEYYMDRHIATVLSWKLPSQYVFERTLRYEGLFAGLNDCLYRSSFNDNYDYVAVFGVDEFLVPEIHVNFPGLMEHLDPIVDGSNKHASFVFRNAFFYTMYQDDYENKDRSVPYLYTQAKTWRVKELQPPGVLSRNIVRGKDVVELGNYKVAEFRQGSSNYPREFDEIVVNPDVAILHHYSPCEAEETGCYLKAIVVDKRAHAFTQKLGPNVAATCKYIFGNDGCPFVEKQSL